METFRDLFSGINNHVWDLGQCSIHLCIEHTGTQAQTHTNSVIGIILITNLVKHHSSKEYCYSLVTPCGWPVGFIVKHMILHILSLLFEIPP